MDQKRIGAFIRDTRKEAGLTQEQFAEKLGVSQRSVSRWETGRTMPDYALLPDICEVLQVNVAELLGGARIEGESVSKTQVTSTAQSILALLNSRTSSRRILGAVVAAVITLVCMAGLYHLEFNVSVESTADLEQAINAYHFNEEVSADVLERRAIRNRLYVLYGEKESPSACGLACLEKGIFGKYRFISCEDTDYCWINAGQTTVGKTKYCITYCVKDLPGIDGYGFQDVKLDYHGSPFLEFTEVAEDALIGPFEIKYYQGDHEIPEEDLEALLGDRFAEGAPAAGYGSAEMGMVYVLEGILLLLGIVIVRYLLTGMKIAER